MHPLFAATPDEAADRLRAGGPAALDDLEALHLACGLAEAEAAALLAAFGSLVAVLGASGPDLQRTVSQDAASRVILVRDLVRRILAAPLRARRGLPSAHALEDYLRGTLSAAARPHLHVLYLDGRNRLIRDEDMAEGSLDHVPIYPREILRRALELNAAAVVLAHQHPSGDAAPTRTEIEVTRDLTLGARALNIRVADHLILADGAIISFRAAGLL